MNDQTLLGLTLVVLGAMSLLGGSSGLGGLLGFAGGVALGLGFIDSLTSPFRLL